MTEDGQILMPARMEPVIKELMVRYRVSAEGFNSMDVECAGCSGDALQLALAKISVKQWKVNRRSPDGRNWFFDVTLAESGQQDSTEFQVETLG